MKKQNDERMMDLLCDQALVGLSDEELRELEGLVAGDENRNEVQGLELAAAKISMIGVDKDAQMPDHLFRKIVEESKAHVASEQNIYTTPRGVVDAERVASGSFWGWLGWAVAAAACIALAINLLTTRQPGPVVVSGPGPSPTPVEDKLTPAQMRQRMIDTEPLLAMAEWGKGNMPTAEGISGDVVWSDAKQVGYLRISGLPVNDPTKVTYQLWIFDETQSEKTPIDGGIFDVTESGEMVIPIDAKLTAKNPKAFAITMEKPGGVVVSVREKVAGLATVKTGQT